MGRTMYNREWKAKFVSQHTDNIKTAEYYEKLFITLAPFEEKWGADICTRTEEEIAPVLEELSGARAKSRYLRHVALKNYVRWCIANEYPGAIDGVSGIEIAGLDKIRGTTLKSPADLQKFLDSICDPESDETVDNTYRCLYWMAYAGLPEEEAMDVRAGEVDFENMVIRHKEFTIPIYRESIPAFKNAAMLASFLYKHPKYEVVRPRTDGDQLLRGIRGLSTVLAMRVEMSRRNRKALEDGLTNKHLSYYRVWLSGLFYRMREREEIGYPVDFSAAVAEYRMGKMYDPEVGLQPAEKRRGAATDFRNDYDRWKAAHFVM